MLRLIAIVLMLFVFAIPLGLPALLVCWLTVYLLTKHFSVRKLLN